MDTQVHDMMTHLHSDSNIQKNTFRSILSHSYVAAPEAVLTFELSFRTNPVALFSWGQGEGWGCHGNPSSGKDEHREGRAVATYQHLSFHHPHSVK